MKELRILEDIFLVINDQLVQISEYFVHRIDNSFSKKDGDILMVPSWGL